MAKSETKFISFHEDRNLFRESILYTARETGLAAALVEKDYFCSVILHHLFAADSFGLIFKGGTCLSKIHADFYRLSEDLDFIISISSDASRSERSKTAVLLKTKIDKLKEDLPIFELPEGLRGHNNSKQYIAYSSYISAITSKPEPIKIEIGLREEALMDVVDSEARTLLINPFSEQLAVEPFRVIGMSLKEAYAEKVRAALTRRDPAIRDFFDVDFAVRELGFDLHEDQFLELVRAKLAVPDNDSIDLSVSRKEALNRQLDTQLKSVLRSEDFEKFELDRAFEIVVDLRERL